jgi:hypothetical protein
VGQGQIWKVACYVSGFPTWQAALQFEWRLKQLTRKLTIQENPLERRFKALDALLALERSTSKAIPYSEWPSPPVIHKL